MKMATAAAGLLMLGTLGWAQSGPAPQGARGSRTLTEFQKSLAKLAGFSPNPCGPPYGEESDRHSADVERRLFEQAADIVNQALNAGLTRSGPPQDSAAEALKELERMSAGINAAWPEENRFHFEILAAPPALIVKMAIRTHETFEAFGLPAGGPSNREWQRIGTDAQDGDVPQIRLSLYPLQRDSSGGPRFLAAFVSSGCAGSIGVAYDAYAWNPRSGGYLEQLIQLRGALGLDGGSTEFPQVGELHTEGSLLTLPYCWFSSIDTFDNPSLCAVDTYDLSGREAQFRSRTYNRPDLLPVAKAIEYAEQRDYRAVLAYCASAQVAKELVRRVPPDVFAGFLKVTPTGNGKERVELGDDGGFRFDVEKRGGEWVVAGFRMR